MYLFKKRTKKLIVIDFGKSLTKIVYLEILAGGFKLLNYGLNKASDNDAEDMKTKEFINNFLKNNLSESKDAYLSIPVSDTLAVKYLSMPVFPKEEILEAAKWQLQEEIPFDLENALFDWQVIREYKDEDGARKNGIIFAVAKKETVDRYVSIVRGCHLIPAAIYIAPFNYANLFSYYSQRFPAAAILDIGGSDSFLGVYSNDKLHLFRKLVFSNQKLVQALTGSMLTAKGKIENSPGEAQELIKTFGILQEGTQILEDNIQANSLKSLLRPHLEILSRELKASFDYACSNFDIESPAVLYLTGGGANLKNLSLYLQQKLNINVEYLSFPNNINIANIEERRLETDKNQLINAVGLALKGNFSVNLLPNEFKVQKTDLFQRMVIRLTVLTFGVILLILFLTAKFQAKDYENRLKNARVHLENMAPIEALRQKVDSKDSMLTTIQKGVVPADGILKLVSLLTPPEIILEEISFNQLESDLTLTGTVIAVDTAVESVLVGFIQQLDKTLFIEEASLMFSEKRSGSQKFGIKCAVIHELIDER